MTRTDLLRWCASHPHSFSPLFFIIIPTHLSLKVEEKEENSSGEEKEKNSPGEENRKMKKKRKRKQPNRQQENLGLLCTN